jgi:hypothetical protein
MNWLLEFERFFKHKERALSAVLDLHWARESWLRTELFLHFHDRYSGFRVNSYAGRQHFDLVCPDPALVAKLNLFGTGSQRRVVTGGKLDCEQVLAHPIGSEDRVLVGGWGLMRDYFKLLRVPKELTDASKVLILVADVKESNDDLTRVLRAIRFEAKETREVPLSRGLIRMWQIS